MGTSRQTMDFLQDQLDRALPITTRKMFGEYCVYWDGKPVAFVCDDQLFVKPTEAGRAMQNPVVEGAPYPGAKMYLLVGEDLWEARPEKPGSPARSCPGHTRPQCCRQTL